jgi:hypothetical protein
VAQKLRARTMPPAGMPRPDADTYKVSAMWLEQQLDAASQAKPYAGRPLLHRLNRTEYTNAIRDIFALEIDGTSLLPPDDAAYGFDNIAEALGFSPSLQERYLTAAGKIAALAVGDRTQGAASRTWRVRQDLSQDQHLDGLPFGTTGGIAVRHTFPLDGQYEFRADLYRTNLNIVRGLQTVHRVEFTLDGKLIHSVSIGGPEDLASLFEKPTDTGDAVDARLRVRVPVTAGPHTIAVAFVQNNQAAEPVRLQPFLRSSVDNFDWAGYPHLRTLTATGPFDANGVANTPSRQRIFVCRPAKPAEETPCARRIVSTLIRRAYRQPAQAGDIARALRFYETARTQGDFDSGIQAAIERILASPKFLVRPEGSGPLSGIELASRLSFFLWSTVPDDQLLTLGERGLLKQPAVLNREMRRMLADTRSQALVSNFAGQWLQLRNLKNFQPNTDRFPDFDDNLRTGFQRETEMLFASVLHENRSVLDLLNADYTFLNERLARHYGVPNIYGSQFRRVPVTADARRGILGHGSILALTSHAERTSPVVRGKWVLENLLGQTVPPPPANVPPLKERQDGERPRTMREQMAEHRANAVCAACHKTLDPIGFALENFDAIGSWRSADAGQPIDSSGELADGTAVQGVVGLRQAILSQPEQFARALTTKLMTYALGRGVDHRDMPQIRALVRDAAKDNYRLEALLSGIVTSNSFRNNAEAGND